jgi:hypothetical protein
VTPAGPAALPSAGSRRPRLGRQLHYCRLQQEEGKEPFVRGLLLGPCSLSEMGCQRLNAQVTGLYIPDLDVGSPRSCTSLMFFFLLLFLCTTFLLVCCNEAVIIYSVVTRLKERQMTVVPLLQQGLCLYTYEGVSSQGGVPWELSVAPLRLITNTIICNTPP